MHTKISKPLRALLHESLPGALLIESHSAEGGFEDTYELRNTAHLKAYVAIVGSSSTDTFSVRVKWDSNGAPAKNVIFYRPSFAESEGLRIYDFSNIPTQAEFELGILVHGRNTTYHFLDRPTADAAASVAQLYSSGDGPDYRLKRVPRVVDLVVQQVKRLLNPYLDALEAHLEGRHTS
jgi:hypothetical protein